MTLEEHLKLLEDWVKDIPDNGGIVSSYTVKDLILVIHRAIQQRNGWINQAIMNNADIAVQESDECIEYYTKDDDVELLAILEGNE